MRDLLDKLLLIESNDTTTVDEEGRDTQRDKDAVDGKPRKNNFEPGASDGETKDRSKDKKAALDAVKKQFEGSDDSDEQTFEGEEFYEYYGFLPWHEDIVDEAEYQGRKVKLGKPMQGDVKKFKVYVRDPKTKNVKKVNFGDPNMRIKKSNPKRRKSFRARHNCDNPGPRTKARYWSCRKW